MNDSQKLSQRTNNLSELLKYFILFNSYSQDQTNKHKITSSGLIVFATEKFYSVQYLKTLEGN